MRVLFITQGTDAFSSSRTRVYQYLPHLPALGVTAAVYPIEPTWARYFDYQRYRLRGLGRKVYSRLYYPVERHVLRRVIDRRIRHAVGLAAKADLVFLQRRILPPARYAMLRQNAARLIYDFDDAIHLGSPEAVNEQIRMSDLTIAANEQLAHHAETINPRVVVIPTPIDTDRYVPVDKTARSQSTSQPAPVVIGWIGSPSNTKYLQGIAEPLRQLAAAYGDRIQLRYVGADPAAEALAGASFYHWSLDTELAQLGSFDIGIMPLPDGDEWAAGKAGYKLLQYMAMGIPCVASPVGANSHIVVHGQNGFLARNHAEWVDYLSRLIDAAALRQTMGAAGRRMAEQQYAHRRLVHDLVHACTAVMERQPRPRLGARLHGWGGAPALAHHSRTSIFTRSSQ